MKLWQVVSFSEPEQLLGIARAAEEAGLEGVLLSDHLFFPARIESRYPYSEDGKPAFDGTTPFPEPWTTIAAMAAVTTRLRFATMVYILPLRHPLEVAKAVGTAALLSGGRVALGVGAGWIREEFDVLGVDFATRGARMDEMIDVMRKAWTGALVEHHGRFFDLPPLQMSPAPPAPPPIWVGGLSPAAFRRAATRADGWLGTGQTLEEAVRIVGELRRLRAASPRAGTPFEAIVPLAVPADRDLLRRLSDAGVTATTIWPFSYTIGPGSTLAEKRDAMLRTAEALTGRAFGG